MLQRLGFCLILLLFCGPAISQPKAVAKPELVLLIAIDQLRRDRADASLPGGLGRLLRGGRVFVNAQLQHALSTTCGGHATMLTGRFPGPIGVPDNSHLDRASWKPRYCVEDPDAPMLGLQARAEEVSGRSPKLIQATGFGDWLQQFDPKAQVISLGGKDRAVISLGGKRPSAAVWFDRTAGRFNTSRYYAEQLPSWVAPASQLDLFAALPERWNHPAGTLRPDDFPGENDEFGSSSGHPLGGGSLSDIAEQFYASPWIDDAVLEFADRAIVDQGLMTNQRTDLLALSLPATDIIGHRYGPYSAEADDALRRLDVSLGELLASIDAQSEPGDLLVVVTSDHGVAALPEWLQAQDEQPCPISEGRVSALSVLGGLMWKVYREFSAPFGLPQRMVTLGGSMLYVTKDPKLLGKRNHAQVVAEVEAYLESQAYVAQVWTAQELHEQAPSNPMAQLYLNSYSPDNSGDLMIQLEPGCQLTSTGTNHGSPYPYDLDIPLVFYGASIVAGKDSRPAGSVDIATTLADILSIPTPAGLDGQVLPVSLPVR